ESGDEALQQLAQRGFVLMLCDVRMPGLSGVEVVPRALQLDSELAIMMLTAVNDAPTATESLSYGAMDYLMKPVELADLEVAVEHVRLAGRLHDVGKIGTREAVLNKPGALTAEEFAHVKEHVRIGMEILAPLKHLGEALTYVQDHHEHWDGTGYPRGLQTAQI